MYRFLGWRSVGGFRLECRSSDSLGSYIAFAPVVGVAQFGIDDASARFRVHKRVIADVDSYVGNASSIRLEEDEVAGLQIFAANLLADLILRRRIVRQIYT